MDGSQDESESDKLKLINPKDLEWLAWNHRTWNNQKSFRSRRLMVFAHFNHSLGILPTPEQILHGIVLAQINDFDNYPGSRIHLVVSMYVEMW